MFTYDNIFFNNRQIEMKTLTYTDLLGILKAKRKEKGLIQKDIAEHLESTPQSVLNWEQNKFDMPTTKMLQYAELVGLEIKIS